MKDKTLKKNQTRKALIFGVNFGLMRAVPELLRRSGFSIDIVCREDHLKPTKNSNFVISVSEEDSLIEKVISLVELFDYELIIPCDDYTLKEILDSPLDLKLKKKLLPVTSTEGFNHLFSKIGLSNALAKSTVSTPNYCVAYEMDHLLLVTKTIRSAFLVKVESSNGGKGIFECQPNESVELVLPAALDFPVLVQEKIKGKEYDLSAFFQNEKVIHFSYSRVEERFHNKFGPSSLRTYFQIGDIDEFILLELNEIGRTLKINGFASISCIESSEDGKRYYFEVDLRPNVWIDFPKFFGDDPAIPIKNFFESGSYFSFPYPPNPAFPKSVRMPYCLRMTLSQIVTNRHFVWRFMSFNDWHQVGLQVNSLFFSIIEKVLITPFRLLIPYKARKFFLPYYLKIKYRLLMQRL